MKTGWGRVGGLQKISRVFIESIPNSRILRFGRVMQVYLKTKTKAFFFQKLETSHFFLPVILLVAQVVVSEALERVQVVPSIRLINIIIIIILLLSSTARCCHLLKSFALVDIYLSHEKQGT